MSDVIEEGLHRKGRVAVSDRAPLVHWHAGYWCVKVYENVRDVVRNIARARNGGDIDPVDDPMRVIAKHGLANDTMLPGNQVSSFVQPGGEFVKIHGPVRITTHILFAGPE